MSWPGRMLQKGILFGLYLYTGTYAPPIVSV
jgi:hypothetical protein